MPNQLQAKIARLQRLRQAATDEKDRRRYEAEMEKAAEEHLLDRMGGSGDVQRRAAKLMASHLVRSHFGTASPGSELAARRAAAAAIRKVVGFRPSG